MKPGVYLNRTAARLDRLLRALGVTTVCIVPDVLAYSLHAFVPYHLAPLVLMFLERERPAGQLIKVSSINLLADE